MKLFVTLGVIISVVLSVVPFVSGAADVWVNKLHVTSAKVGGTGTDVEISALTLVLVGHPDPSDPPIEKMSVYVRFHGSAGTADPLAGKGTYHPVTLQRDETNWKNNFVGTLVHDRSVIDTLSEEEQNLFVATGGTKGGVEVRVCGVSTYYCWTHALEATNVGPVATPGPYACNKLIVSSFGSPSDINWLVTEDYGVASYLTSPALGDDLVDVHGWRYFASTFEGPSSNPNLGQKDVEEFVFDFEIVGAAEVWLNKLHVTTAGGTAGEIGTLTLVFVGHPDPSVPPIEKMSVYVRFHGSTGTPDPLAGEGTYHTVTLQRDETNWKNNFVGTLVHDRGVIDTLSEEERNLFVATGGTKGGVEVKVGGVSTYYCWTHALEATNVGPVATPGPYACNKLIVSAFGSPNDINWLVTEDYSVAGYLTSPTLGNELVDVRTWRYFPSTMESASSNPNILQNDVEAFVFDSEV